MKIEFSKDPCGTTITAYRWVFDTDDVEDCGKIEVRIEDQWVPFLTEERREVLCAVAAAFDRLGVWRFCR